MTRFRQTLIGHVHRSHCINDLVSLLSFIPLNSLKQFLNEQIKLLNVATSQKAYYHSLSIEQSLPSDIIQHCLSFTDNDQTKLVNKSFKNHYNQNQINLKRHIKRIVNQHHTHIKFVFNENENNVFVIDKSRNKLNEREMSLGYKGPYQNFGILDELIKDGDKILIHGLYEITKGWWQWQPPHKNIQIIGVGNNAILKDVQTDEGFRKEYFMKIENANIHFENITLDSLDYAHSFCMHTFFHVTENAKLSLKNCKIKFGGNGISLHGKSELFAAECMFDGGLSGVTAIYMTNWRVKATVLGCKFNRCGHQNDDSFDPERGSCIHITPLYKKSQLELKCNVKCIGNVFKNNHCYPVCYDWVQEDDSTGRTKTVVGSDLNVDCVLQRNYLQGKNGTHVKQKVDHANKLYFNDDNMIDSDKCYYRGYCAM